MQTSFSLTYEQITAWAERQIASYSETAANLPAAVGVDIAILKTERASVFNAWEQLAHEMKATTHPAYEADKARLLAPFNTQSGE